MARKTKVVVVCDRHRGEVEAVGTMEIVIDGERRKLDLCAEHLAELRRTMRPWFRSSSSTARTGPAGKRSSKTPAKRRGRNTDAAEVRAWAAKNGWDLPGRGRIPTAVREAFTAAR